MRAESFKPLAMVQDGEIYHYHHYHLGMPRELTSQQGKLVCKARYKTYGNVAEKEVKEVENNLRFQGQYFDEGAGLHYNRYRYYDPTLGQFTTQDSIGLLGGAPNSVGWVDPLGLVCKEGYAEIYHYEGDNGPHFAVVTEYKGQRYGTEQWGGTGTKTLDIKFDPNESQGMKLVDVYRVKHP